MRCLCKKALLDFHNSYDAAYWLSIDRPIPTWVFVDEKFMGLTTTVHKLWESDNCHNLSAFQGNEDRWNKGSFEMERTLQNDGWFSKD